MFTPIRRSRRPASATRLRRGPNPRAHHTNRAHRDRRHVGHRRRQRTTRLCPAHNGTVRGLMLRPSPYDVAALRQLVEEPILPRTKARTRTQLAVAWPRQPRATDVLRKRRVRRHPAAPPPCRDTGDGRDGSPPSACSSRDDRDARRPCSPRPDRADAACCGPPLTCAHRLMSVALLSTVATLDAVLRVLFLILVTSRSRCDICSSSRCVMVLVVVGSSLIRLAADGPMTL